MRRRGLRGLCAAIALCLAGGANVAQASVGALPSETQATSSPDGAGTAPAGQAEAHEWFAGEGTAYVRKKAAEVFKGADYAEASAFHLGTPVNARVFEKAGAGGEPKVAASGYWVAPLYRDVEPVGTLAVELVGGKAEKAVITDLPDFAKDVANLDAATAVVVDPETKGWYLVTESRQVSPLDRRARQVLAGTVSLRDFETVRQTLRKSSGKPGQTTTGPIEDETERRGFSRALLLGIMVLLLLAGVAVWLRHDAARREKADGDDAAKGADAAKGDPTLGRDAGPRTILTETGEMVRVYERPTRGARKEAEETEGDAKGP